MARVLIEITYDYLKKLEYPQNVFNDFSWHREIIMPIRENLDLKDLKNTRVNKIAPFLGLLWHNKKDEKLKDILNYSFSDLDKKHYGDWRFKSLTLLVAKICSMTQEEIDKLNTEVYEPTSRELQAANCDYDRVRIDVSNYLTKMKDGITNDNYENVVQGLIKTLAKSLVYNGNFHSVDFKRYVQVFYKRFYNMKTYQEIADEFGIQTGNINNVINKFVFEFDQAFEDEEERAMLCKKFEKFYDSAFYNLNGSDLKERNKRLDILKRFQRHFVAENLSSFLTPADSDRTESFKV